jgi:hypothetical protein
MDLKVCDLLGSDNNLQLHLLCKQLLIYQFHVVGKLTGLHTTMVVFLVRLAGHTVRHTRIWVFRVYLSVQPPERFAADSSDHVTKEQQCELGGEHSEAVW